MNQKQLYETLRRTARIQAIKELIQEFQQEKDDDAIRILETKLKQENNLMIEEGQHKRQTKERKQGNFPDIEEFQYKIKRI